MLGGNIEYNYHVTAIIFRRDGRRLWPANARGVLQLVNDIQNSIKDIHPEKYFSIDKYLGNDSAFENLSLEYLGSWRWDQYGAHYKSFCEAVQHFRCDRDRHPDRDFTAKSRIGLLEPDWHPLGFSRRESVRGKCDRSIWEECNITNFDAAIPSLLEIFGARVFLMNNIEIKTIDGRVMIDFDRPSEQLIPDINM
jgi:hypothetical protein